MRRRHGVPFVLALLVLWGLPFGIVGSLFIWRERQRRAVQQQHDEIATRMRKLAAAMLTYVQDHGERFPPADRWEQALHPYAAGISVTLPPGPDGRPRRFAMNRALSGRSLAEFGDPMNTVLLFESTLATPNAADDLRSIPANSATGLFWVCFADGHGYPRAFGERQELIDRSHHAFESR